MRKFFAAAAVIALLSSPAGASRLRLTAPVEAPVGQPFFVELRTNEQLGEVTVRWREKEYTLVPRLNTVRTVRGFPNDSKLIGQTLPLVLEFEHEGRTIVVERDITATAFDYPRQEITVAPKMVNPPKS